MKHQKKIIEAIEALGFRQHATNKKLWYKPIGDVKYTINMSGTIPAIAKYRGTDELFDENDEEIIKIEDAIAEIIGEPTPPAPTPPSDQAVETKQCALCDALVEKSTMSQIGYPETHDVCDTCATKVTENKVDVDHWYTETTTPVPTEEEESEIPSMPDEPDAPEKHDEPDMPVEPEKQESTEEPDEPSDPVEQEVTETLPQIQEKAVERGVSRRIYGIMPQLEGKGNIKIGFKGEMITSQRGTDFRPPQKSDHFTITTTEKDTNDNFIVDKHIMEKIGENCTKLDVMVLFNDPDLVFRTSYAFFMSSKCECRGDGRTAQLANGDIIDCNPEACETFQEKACKPNGILSVILMDDPRVGGVHIFRTTSWNTIRNITSSLDYIRSLTFGQLAGLPLELTLRPKTTTIPGLNKKTTIYMANIVFKGSMRDLLDTAVQIATNNADRRDEIKQIEDNARLMLNEAPTAEECKDMTEEFYPATVMKEIEANT